MDPEYSHQGVSSIPFPPTEYDIYWLPGEREVLHPSAQQLEIFPDDKRSGRLNVPQKNLMGPEMERICKTT